ncbi:MAG: ATP-binding protein [Bacteroidota bacterium]
MLRIAVTGPESTGKSTLSEDLAKELKTVWVPEFAREYIEMLRHPYTQEDVEKIAHGQMKSEEEKLHTANNYLICDTELTVIKIWMEHKYGTCPNWIKEHITNKPYDLYLLCDIDIPWTPDPQREHPESREHFFLLFLNELKLENKNYVIIHGDRKQRLQTALNAIEELSKNIIG